MTQVAVGGSSPNSGTTQEKKMDWTKELLLDLCAKHGVTFYNATLRYGPSDERSYCLELFSFSYTLPDQPNPDKRVAVKGFQETKTERDETGRLTDQKTVHYYLQARPYGKWVSEPVKENTLEAWCESFSKLLGTEAYQRALKYEGRAFKVFAEKLKAALKELGAFHRKKFFCGSTHASPDLTVGNWTLCLNENGDCVDVYFDDQDKRHATVRVDSSRADFDQKVEEVLTLVKQDLKPAKRDPKPASLKNVKYRDYDLYTGGEREYGVFKVTWDTDKGELTYTETYSAVETDTQVWELDSKTLKGYEWDVLAYLLSDELSARDLSPPTYEGGQRAEKSWRKDFEGVDFAELLKKLKKAKK